MLIELLKFYHKKESHIIGSSLEFFVRKVEKINNVSLAYAK